ncbi:MAG: hypothetical protein KDB55_11125 [Mycobacterium sp.]|nr:hypothetical protein [Mycobacterium sp.]
MIGQFGVADLARAAALLAAGAMAVACSSSADKPMGSATTSSTPTVSRLADLSSQFSPLSMNRACTVDVTSAECASVTAQKIDLTKQVQPELRTESENGLVADATRVADRILNTASTWSALGCQARPATPGCADPASAVESDFSVLAAYLLQISGG